MTLIYQEFDITQADLIPELVTRITAHPDWAVLVPTPVSTTTTSSTSSTTEALNVVSTAGFNVNQRVKVTAGSTTHYRVLVSISDETTMTVNGTSWGGTLPSGSLIETDTTMLKCTTTRGADMIVDLQAGDPLGPETYRMNVKFWQYMDADYATMSPLDSVERFLYFRASGGTGTQTVHVTLSVSKEHLFLMVEGPRAHEAGAYSSTYGSLRNYLFVCDVVPYHANDAVPCVVASSGTVSSAAASINSQAHIADLSRTADDTESWQGCRLATLSFPTVQDLATVAVERDCAIDGNKYLFPYVVFGNKEGIRGRLRSFFYAGSTQPSSYSDNAAPVGEKVTYEGIVYKLIAVNKGDGTNDAWGVFGAADNGNANAGRSVVVAVPVAEAI